MPKQYKIPRFDVDYQTRLAQQRNARDLNIGKKPYWVAPLESTAYMPSTKGVATFMFSKVTAWEKQMLSESEVTMLLLQDFQVKKQDPLKQLRKELVNFYKNRYFSFDIET